MSAPDDLMDFDQVLNYTQTERVSLINTIKKQAETIQDPAQQSILLKALSDMDKGVVSKRRLGIEEEAQKTADENSRNVSELLRNIKATMFHSPSNSNRPAPTLGDDIPMPSLVPGEIDIGVAALNYDSFLKGLPEISEES